jgi:pimeloyl-ACP methyl ester carboxylesterase
MMTSIESTSSFKVDDQRLIYTVAGRPEAPPLILLHGFVSHRGIWRQTLATCQSHYYGVAVDLLGFGDSDKPIDADYTPLAQARRVLQLVDALGFERFALAGHSMGGQIALVIAALLAPERVTRLLTVASVVTGQLTPVVSHLAYPQIVFGALFPGLYALWRQWARHPWYGAAMFQHWFHRLDAVPFQEWAIDREMALQPGIHQPAYQAAEGIRRLNLTPHLKRITIPTLVIVGRQDQIVPITDSLAIAEQVADAQLMMIDHCGHFPMYEHPQHYTCIVQNWMLDNRL